MNTKSKWKSFSLLTGSILIMAVGIYFFKFANNFTFGGITGLAVLVAKTGVMSASDFTFLTNMLLLLLGFIVLGKKIWTEDCLLQHTSLRHSFPFRADLPNEPSTDRSADARVDLCDRTAGIWLRHFVQYRSFQRRYGYHCSDFKEILRFQYRKGASAHRSCNHNRRMFCLRHRDRTLFFPWSCCPLTDDRQCH